MTYKQIIIDGVDVSGCTHYRNYNDEFHCDLLSEPLVCVDNPNCYYKQLKAKEQECEELKEQLQCCECKWWKQLDQLKAENEKLDTENKRLVAELANPVFDSFEELEKLKQTLTEIEEIAEKTLNMVDYKTYFKTDNKSFKQEGFKAIDQILQKISEVENG